MPAWTQVGRALHRLQDRHRVSRTTPSAASRRCYGSYLLMSGDTGEPLAVMDGARADRLAHRLRLGARGALSRARGRLASGHGRRRRARAASRSARTRAVRPIKRVTLWNRTRSRAISTAFALSAAGIEADHRRRSRSGGARSRHRVLRDAVGRAADQGRVAEEGRASSIWSARFTPKMREADDAAVQARARLCRHPRRRAPRARATSPSR